MFRLNAPRALTLNVIGHHIHVVGREHEGAFLAQNATHTRDPAHMVGMSMGAHDARDADAFVPFRKIARQLLALPGGVDHESLVARDNKIRIRFDGSIDHAFNIHVRFSFPYIY